MRDTIGVMTAKTNAQKQADLRARRLADGMTEVRGIYAKLEHHAKIKAYAKTLQKDAKKA